MFNRSRLAENDAAPIVSELPLSPAAVAAAVKRSGALVKAEAENRRLRDARDLAVEEARALVAHRGDVRTGRAAELRISELATARTELEAQINEIRPVLMQMRRAHAAAVRKALEPTMQRAAAVAVRAIAELTTAVEMLEAAEVEANRPVGGARDRHWHVPLGLGALEHAARRVAGKFGQ